MADISEILKRMDSYRSDLPSSGQECLDELSDAIHDLKVENDNQDSTIAANAALIASIPDMVKALESIAEFCNADGSTLGAISRLTHIRNTAQDALAAYRSEQK